MTTLSTRDFTARDAEYLSQNLREEDVREIAAGLAKDPEQALLFGLSASKVCKALVNQDDKPVAVFGMMFNPFDMNTGMIWMLASNEFKDSAYQFLREGRDWIKYFHEYCPVLWTFSHSENTAHHEWLKWSGFDQAKTLTLGEEQEEFFEFIKLKQGMR